MLAERIEAHPAPCGARFYSDEIVPPTDGFDFSASLSAMPRQIQPPLCARPSRVLLNSPPAPPASGALRAGASAAFIGFTAPNRAESATPPGSGSPADRGFAPAASGLWVRR